MKIVDNNSRDMDPEYRKDIEREMQAAARLFNMSARTLTTANVEKEMEFVLAYVKNISQPQSMRLTDTTKA